MAEVLLVSISNTTITHKQNKGWTLLKSDNRAQPIKTSGWALFNPDTKAQPDQVQLLDIQCRLCGFRYIPAHKSACSYHFQLANFKAF